MLLPFHKFTYDMTDSDTKAYSVADHFRGGGGERILCTADRAYSIQTCTHIEICPRDKSDRMCSEVRCHVFSVFQLMLIT